LRSPEGTPLSAEALGLGPGTRLPLPTAADAAALTARLRATRRHEARWVRRLASVRPLDLPYCGVAGPVAGAGGHAEGGAGVVAYDVAVPSGLVAGAGVEPPLAALAGVLLYLGRVAGVAGEAAGDVGLRAAADPGPYFAQTVPLRVPAAADGTGFAAYCGQLAAAVAEVEAWGGTYPRDLGVRHPALTGAPGLPVVVGAEGGAGGAVPGAAVQVVVAPDGEHCRLLLAADRVEPGAADALRTDLAAFLTALAGAPGDIGAVPLLSGPRRAQVLEEWNATDTAARPDARVCDLFAAQAASRPDAVAVVADDATLTYAELAARASRVAAALSRAGIGPGDLVGVHLGRGADLVAALLGVMHAGAAYVPLDPLYPADRIRAMAEDAGLRLLLTGGGLPLPPELAATGIARLDVTDPALPPGEAGAPAPAATPPQAADAGPGAAGPGAQLPHRAGDLAYVIYTSGSTGRPKGVRIGHRALTNFLLSMAAEPGCRPGERLLAVTTVCFDIAGLELFLPLVTGGCVELVPAEVARDGFALCQRLRRSRPALMQATPATWRLLTAAGWEGDGNLRALCGGEPLPADLANELLDRTGELWNLYGPTETTVWSTAARVRPGDRITLGRPLANTRCYVLDRSGRPLPPYVPGELCIGGAGVAEGYLGRPELTAEKFVPDPFTGTGRLYRTGDLVRRLGDGRLDCLGRIDDQVKIDGFRIEPGEIEAALLRHPGVRRAVVAARADAAGTRRLVAYVVPAGQVAPGAEELRRHLARDLPGYMVPARYVPLPEIPLTRNGKVDRKALPDPPRTTATALPPAARPRTAPEAAVARVWRAVLGRDDIGLDDNFFDAGGTSLLLTQAVTRLNAELGVRLRSVDMFRNPTVRTMAGCLAAPAAPPAAADEPARRIDRSLIRRRKRRA
jgi:polyketide synthase PksN